MNRVRVNTKKHEKVIHSLQNIIENYLWCCFKFKGHLLCNMWYMKENGKLHKLLINIHVLSCFGLILQINNEFYIFLLLTKKNLSRYSWGFEIIYRNQIICTRKYWNDIYIVIFSNNLIFFVKPFKKEKSVIYLNNVFLWYETYTSSKEQHECFYSINKMLTNLVLAFKFFF